MPTVIAIETEKVWDTTTVTITYSDRSRRIIEIEEGAEIGSEQTEIWEKPNGEGEARG